MLNFILNRERNKLIFLSILMFVSSLFELVVVFGSGAIISSIIDPNNKTSILTFLEEKLSYHIVYLGYIFIVLTSSVMSIVVLRNIAKLTSYTGVNLSNYILLSYLKNNTQNLNVKTGYILKQIMDECQRFTGQILMTGLQGMSKALTALLLFAGLIIAYPAIAATIIILLTLAYSTIFLVLRGRLEENGRMQSDAQANRLITINSFLSNRLYTFLYTTRLTIDRRLREISDTYASVQSNNLVLTQFPKHVIEALLFLILPIGLVVGGAAKGFVADLAVFGFAAIKILPCVQQVYYSVATIRGNIASFNNLNSQSLHVVLQPVNPREDITSLQLLAVEDERISTKEPISLDITANSKIYIVGPSGSGKTTLLRIILGVTKPDSGNVKINGKEVTIEEHLGYVINNFALVEQFPYFIDGNLCEVLNIDFDKHEIALEMLSYFDLKTKVYKCPAGELSINTQSLSGGERQRLAIVRAFLSEKKYIILDEPLSALDSATTSLVLDMLNSQLRKSIIIVSHIDLSSTIPFDEILELR